MKCMSADAAIELRVPGERTSDAIWLPFEFLADVEGKKDDPVELTATGKKQVTAQWRDGNVPQIVQYDSAQPPEKFPVPPTDFATNVPGLLQAFHEASEVTDPDNPRFAIGCIQLCPDGTINATDGRQRLGSLYNPSDYPSSLAGLFGVEFDFPSIEPPSYLQSLNPELYEQECQRVQARFDEAVRLAEEAFIAELAKLVSHLTERLSGTDDGKPRIFRDSAVENLTEFFQRFRQLNVRSSEQLDRLVADAQGIVRGVEPQALRDDAGLRQHVASEMSRVQSVLDGLLVDRPRRNILRRPR